MADQNTVRTLTIRQVQDASAYVAGAREFVAANKDMASSSSVVGTVVTQTQAKISNAADPISRLVRAYDQSSASAIKFNNELSVLNKQLESGRVSAEAAGRIYAGMVKSFSAAADGADLMANGYIKLGTVVSETNAEMLRMRQSAAAAGEAAAELETLTSRATALKAALDPVGASQARLTSQMAEYNAMLRAGLINIDEFTAAELRARQQHDQLIASFNRTPAAVNDNTAGFRKQNLIYQGFDVVTSLGGGISPGVVALQQGPQIIQGYLGQGGVKGLLTDIGELAGGVARALGPIGIGIAAVGTAAAAYYLTIHDSQKQAAADLKQHIDDIEALAQAWGDQIPAVGEYYKALREAEALQEQQQAVKITEGADWKDAAAQFQTFSAAFDRARSLIDTTNPIGKLSPLADAIRDYQILKQKVAEHTATLEDAEKVSKDLSTVYEKMPLDVFTKALASLKTFETELDTAKDKTEELANQFAKLGGLRPFQVQDLIHNRGSGDAPALQLPEYGPIPQPRPNIELEGDPYENKTAAKVLSDYEQMKTAADARIADLQSQIKYSGLATDASARLLAQDQAETAYREAIARANGKVNDDEIKALREKADLQARLNQQLAGINFDKGQQDQVRELQLQADLIGKSADQQARMTAAFQVEQQLRAAGLPLLGEEADRRKAIAESMATASLQIQRQQAAYQSLQQAERDAIDTLVTGSHSMKDVLNNALTWLEQMAVANPLKNALTGTNLPTLGDLFSGKPTVPGAAAATTAMMNVTATTVMINGSPVGGLPGLPLTNLPAVQPGTLGSYLGLKAANQNVAPTLNASGLVNVPPAANAAIVPSSFPSAGYTKTGIPLSTITTNNGLPAQVNSQYAGNFQGFINDLQSQGYQINNISGYNYKNIAGTNRLSNHAFGDAIDINPQQNPVTYPGKGQGIISDLPSNVQDTAAKYGLEQGIWRSKYDPMHFEVQKGAQPLNVDQANQSLQKLSTTTSSTSKDLGSLGDTTNTVGKTLTDTLGQSSPLAKVPSQLPSNYFPPAPTAGSSFSQIPIIGPIFSGISNLFSLFGFADGSDSTPEGWSWVGERGPELRYNPRGSKIVPNHKLNQFAGGGEMKVTHFHEWNVNVSGNGDRDLMDRMQTAADHSVAAAMRHYDANILPGRVQDIQQNPDHIG